MRVRPIFFAFALAVCFVTLPDLAAAKIPFFGPIIPQTGSSVGDAAKCPLGWAALITVINNIISFLITIAITAVAPIMIGYAGFLFVVNPVNASGKEEAKTILWHTIIGIVIALSGYLIVNAVMAVLYKPEAFGKEWYELVTKGGDDLCIRLTGAGSLSQAGTPPPPPGGGAGCPTCVSLSNLGLSCKVSTSCTLEPGVAAKLTTLKGSFSGTWIVTEAFPPTITTHTNQCHYNGTCIDAGFRSPTTYTGATVIDFANKANSAGLRAVFETDDCSLRDAVRLQGGTAYCKTDSGYGHITGSHFSVYNN
ncbi:MAG TPA: hypothetical protein VM103_02770 [Candidatus Paceibacterota bacterium]|nr:hypothetical protein [Candidatus Paceibacterota bacterium]